MDPFALIGAVISAAFAMVKADREGKQNDHLASLDDALQALRAAFIVIAQQMLACALYELRKTELDMINANIKAVQEILDSIKNAVPPPDTATAGDLSYAENQALTTVQLCKSLQNELQSDDQPEASIRELLITALAAEVDAGLLRYTCLIRWEDLGVADQTDEKVATLNDLLDGCDTALTTLRTFDDKHTRFISRRYLSQRSDDARVQRVWEYGYVDDGRYVWMYTDVLDTDRQENSRDIRQVKEQVASLQEAHFLNDPDVQAVQQMEQTIKVLRSRLRVVVVQKLPDAGSVYQAPNRTRLAAQERFAKAVVAPSQIAPKSTPPVVEKSGSGMSKPPSEIMANPKQVPFLGRELSIDAQEEQHPVNEVTFTLAFTAGIFDRNAPERNINIPVFIMDEFGNKPSVQPEYQLSSKGATVTATVQVPMQDMPETTNISRDIFIVADPLNSIAECKQTNSWKKVSVGGIAESRPMQAV